MNPFVNLSVFVESLALRDFGSVLQIWCHFTYNAIRLRIINPDPLSPNLNPNPNS